jgi:hypothetical protein
MTLLAVTFWQKLLVICHPLISLDSNVTSSEAWTGPSWVTPGSVLVEPMLVHSFPLTVETPDSKHLVSVTPQKIPYLGTVRW